MFESQNLQRAGPSVERPALVPSGQPTGLLAVVDVEGLRRLIGEAMAAHLGATEAAITRSIEAALANLRPAAQSGGLLTEKQVALRLGVSPRTVRRLERAECRFPAAIRVGGVRRWRPEVVETWLESRLPAQTAHGDAQRSR